MKVGSVVHMAFLLFLSGSCPQQPLLSSDAMSYVSLLL